jgi:hypothetical protein
LFNRRLRAGRLNWIAGLAPALPLSCTACIRYRQADRPAASPAVQVAAVWSNSGATRLRRNRGVLRR